MIACIAPICTIQILEATIVSNITLDIPDVLMIQKVVMKFFINGLIYACQLYSADLRPLSTSSSSSTENQIPSLGIF